MAARVALVLNRGAELRTMAGDGLLTATSTKVFHYASRFLCIQRLCAIGRRGMAPGTWQCHLVDMRRPRCWWHLAPGIAPGLAPGTLQSGTWCGTWHLAPGTWHLAPGHDAVILPWHPGLGAGIIAECRICPAVATTIALCTCSS